MAHAPPSEYGTIRIVRDFCSSDLKSVHPPRYPQIFPTAFSHSTEPHRADHEFDLLVADQGYL